MTFKQTFSGNADELRLALIAELDRRLTAYPGRGRLVDMAEQKLLQDLRTFLADLVIEPTR